MSRPVSALSPHPVLVAILCCAAIVLGSAPARAGLGDLVKKAKEKVTQAAAPKTTSAEQTTPKVVFNDDVLELTPERLDKMIAKFKETAAVTAGRPELVAKLNALEEERGKIWEKDSEKIMDLQRKRGDVEVCYHDGYAEAGSRRMQEYANRALTDPALREKFARVAQQNNAAAMQGDSAAIARAQQAMHEEVLPTKEDSAAVRKQCGAIPPPLASETKINDLDKQIAAVNEKIRAIDAKWAEAQAKDGGMKPHQWAVAIDRIGGFLDQRRKQGSGSVGGKGPGGGSKSGGSNPDGGSGSGGGSGGSSTGRVAPGWVNAYSEVELAALDERYEQLRKHLGS